MIHKVGQKLHEKMKLFSSTTGGCPFYRQAIFKLVAAIFCFCLLVKWIDTQQTQKEKM